MFIFFFAFAQTSVNATQPLKGGAIDQRLSKILDGLQKTYENTSTFDAHFEQRYTYALLKKNNKSAGRVSFQKPGQMRWDYSQPEAKSFIISNDSLWIHQPEDHLAMVNRCFKQDGLTTSISFLWGAGNLRETFHVSFFKGQFGKKESTTCC